MGCTVVWWLTQKGYRENSRIHGFSPASSHHAHCERARLWQDLSFNDWDRLQPPFPGFPSPVYIYKVYKIHILHSRCYVKTDQSWWWIHN